MTRVVENRDGVSVSVAAVEVSAGAADAGRIPQLDPDGLLDLSLFPTSGLTVDWGAILGNLADQADLIAALALKLDDSQASAYGLSQLAAANAAAAKTLLALVAADVGLGNVDNTSDANKPVSTATQTALDLKLDTAALGVTVQAQIAAGTSAQFWRGDKTWQTLNGAAVANTPAGGIAAVTVQAAIDELDTEKAPKASAVLTGTTSIETLTVSANSTLGDSTADSHAINGNVLLTVTGASASNFRMVNVGESASYKIGFSAGSVYLSGQNHTGGAWAPWIIGGSQINFQVSGANILIARSTGTETIGEHRCDTLRIDVAPTAATPVPTHTIPVNCNGTVYRVPCVI